MNLILLSRCPTELKDKLVTLMCKASKCVPCRRFAPM